MRLRIRHLTTYAYETPVARTIQLLRLTPRGHDGQFVVNWQIDVDRDCRLRVATDAFGNTVHSFTDKSAGNDNSKGTAYNQKADHRSWDAMKQFFAEVLK